MGTVQPLVTFTIDQSYEVAVRMVRRALRERGLQIPTEVDVTARLRDEIWANMAPCVVLFVYDPTLLLEGIRFYHAAGLYIPQPVVISATGHSTKVLLRSHDSSVCNGLPPTVRAAILRLHDRVMRAIDTIGELEEAELSVQK